MAFLRYASENKPISRDLLWKILNKNMKLSPILSNLSSFLYNLSSYMGFFEKYQIVENKQEAG